MFASRLLQLLYPGACCACRREGAAFCAGCRPDPQESHAFTAGGVAVRAVGYYAGALRKAVLACKRGRRDVCKALGELLAERLELARATPIAALVPVPTTSARRAGRGFDQGFVLAQAASRAAGIPVLTALRHAGEPQRGKSRVERLAVRHRFSCTGGGVLQTVPVLLIDDVATTGATLRDCARALREAGADVCGAAVVAHALGDAS